MVWSESGCGTKLAHSIPREAVVPTAGAPDPVEGPEHMIEPSTRSHRHSPSLRVAALATVGILLAACGGTPGASLSPTGTATPTLASDAVPSAATPTSDASQAVRPCTTADIDATAGPLGGAAGSRGADVVVRTSGSVSCRLPTSPVVAVVDPAGNVLLNSRLPLTADGPTIQPTKSLSFSFQLSNWCDRSATMPLHFLLALAGGSLDIGGLTLAAGDLPPCNGPGQPASISTTDWEHR